MPRFIKISSMSPDNNYPPFEKTSFQEKYLKIFFRYIYGIFFEKSSFIINLLFLDYIKVNYCH